VTTDESGGRGRELAGELRRSRLVAGMSRSEVARRTGLSESEVFQLEDGQLLPSLDQVGLWGVAVGVSDLVRRRWQSLTEAAAATEVIAIRHVLRVGPTAIGEDVGRLEAASARVRSCHTSVVPGLLQIPEYARLVMGSLERPRADLEAATKGRIARQRMLRDPARSFEFIVTEYGLKWSPVGTPRAVMRDQLSHIREMAELPNVSVGVIRTGVQTKLALTSFNLYEDVRAEESTGRIDIVMLETPAAMIVVTEPADVAVYRSYLAWFREAADFSPNAVSIIRSRRS
jgi:transcriptional regulator with XRE-family HTH domain